MASVGLGMSVFATPEQPSAVICHFASGSVPDGDRQKPSPEPRCPFCFVAAQSATDNALVGEATTLPAYAGVFVAAILGPIGDGTFVSQFRRTTGDPRAPPAFSV